jgi:flagellar biosynthesis/type III secretory pathway chaperone
MTSLWKTVAESLRAEVAEYGRLLHLMEEQRDLIFRRDPAAILLSNKSIQAQVDVLHECRRRREEVAAQLAQEHARPPNATLRSLVPLVAPEGRPLLEALIAEVNRLVHRVRRIMRLNERLLATAVDCQQELLRRLWPSAFTKTYAADGRVTVSTPRLSPSLQNAG